VKKTALAALLLAPLAAMGDVDVAVTAGSPLEWLHDVPKPIISTDRTQVLRKRSEGTQLATEAAAPEYKNTDLFNYFRVTTVDLVGEIPWATVRNEKKERSYPPALTTDVYWQALIVYLRRLLHPAQLLEGEAIQYLIYLGEPARAAAEAACAEPQLKTMTDAVLKAVSAVPPAPPEFPQGRDGYESMLIRVAYEDLLYSYPFSLSRPFAPRISLMGAEAVPYVIEASRSEHSYLRHNAILWLSLSEDPRALQALRDAFKNSPDPVVRNRCLEAFARKRDRALVPELIEQLKSTTDFSYRCFLTHVLGRIGDKRAVPAILSLLTSLSDFDFRCSALCALSRLGEEKEKSRAVRSALSSHRGSSARNPATTYSPCVPDAPDARTQTLRQLSRIGLCMVNIENHNKQEMIKLCSPDPQRPARIAYQRGLFEKFPQPTMYLLMEALAGFSEGREILFKFIRDNEADVTVRAYAAAKLAVVSSPDVTDFFKETATPEAPQPIAEIALRALETSDPAAAREAALTIVNKAGPKLDPGRRYVVALAARLLASKKEVGVDRLVQLIENELILSEWQERTKGEKDASDFTSTVPALEQLVIELGELKSEAAIPMLQDLMECRGARGRAEACVALGKIGGNAAVKLLVERLEDGDGWVRFVAARVLSEISRREFRCDWIYGSEAARSAAAERVREWARNATEGGK
jgi:HEAT repeat protein